MKIVTRIAALWLAIVASLLWAQEPAKAPAKPDAKDSLAALAAAYKSDLDEVAADYEKWLATLQAWYLSSLDKLQAERTKAGDLEGVLAFKAERERIESHTETTREQVHAMPETLAKLRAAYEPALKRIVDQAAQRKDAARGKYFARLEALQKSLTLSIDLDNALLVRAEKDRIAAEMAEAAGPAVAKPEGAGAAVAKPAGGSPLSASKDRPFVNSLGMKFVSVPGTEALFCIWDTRVQDYAAYAGVKKVDDTWKKADRDGVPVSREPECPVVGVNWEEANSFCQWLTEKEMADGKLAKGMKYRLPTDEEWSRAVGLAKEDGDTPKERNGKDQAHFPWGTEFPPSKAKGANYADAAFHEKFPKNAWIEGYVDGYATTSPVGSFPANKYGLYDMGGNVWQWCEDQYEPNSAARAQRGAPWTHFRRGNILSSFRNRSEPGIRSPDLGFRCVIGLPAR